MTPPEFPGPPKPRLPRGTRMRFLLAAMRERDRVKQAGLLALVCPDVDPEWAVEGLRKAWTATRARRGYEASGRLHEILDAQETATQNATRLG